MAKRHPGSIDRRGDTLRIRLCVGGERHQFTIPTTDRKVGERFAREKQAELERQHARAVLGLPTGVRFSALLEQFESQVLPSLAHGTRRTYLKSLEMIRRYFVEECGDQPVERVRARDVTTFLSWRRTFRLKGLRTERPTAPVGAQTLRRDRAVLCALFSLAERMEFVSSNVVKRTDVPKGDARSPIILSTDEYDRLLEACAGRPMLSLYAVVLGETGLRCESEALWLRWEDVDLERGFLHVVSGRDGHRVKSGRSRFVPLTPRLLTAFRAHFVRFRFSGSPWVFHHAVTRRHHLAGDRIKSLRNALRSAAKRAKLSADFHPHDLRHRRVTTWLGDGRSAVLVKEALGHSDLRVTMGYTHLAKEHLRALVDDRAAPPLARVEMGT